MNKNFISVNKDFNKQKILEIMKTNEINQIPIIDNDGKVIDIILLRELIKDTKTCENPVLIMAGGIGSRLMPFTENCPKPMLRIGEKPILEILLEQLIENGFSNFFISVNYLKEQIIDYFKEFDNINPEIDNFSTENNMCGVHIFMTNDEHTIYKKIIEEKQEVIKINIDGLVIDNNN